LKNNVTDSSVTKAQMFEKLQSMLADIGTMHQEVGSMHQDIRSMDSSVRSIRMDLLLMEKRLAAVEVCQVRAEARMNLQGIYSEFRTVITSVVTFGE